MGIDPQIIWSALLMTVVVSAVVRVVYLKFHRGLATQVFAFVGFTIWVVTIMTFIMGRYGLSAWTIGVFVPPGTAISVYTLWRLSSSGLSSPVASSRGPGGPEPGGPEPGGPEPGGPEPGGPEPGERGADDRRPAGPLPTLPLSNGP